MPARTRSMIKLLWSSAIAAMITTMAIHSLSFVPDKRAASAMSTPV